MARLYAPTSGSRMMLWVFPALTLYLGLCYLLQSEARLQSGAFAQAKAIMDMHWWGVVFVVAAIGKTLFILQGSMRAYIVMMCLGAALYLWWGFLFLASAMTGTTGSFTGVAWPLAWCVLHIAMLSTMTNEQSR